MTELSDYELCAELDRLFEACVDRHRAVFGEPVVGRTRAVFSDGDWVVKVPLDEEGMVANEREAAWAADPDCYIPVAPCELDDSHPDGVPVLRMARVEPVTGISGLPDWVLSVDCQQVGHLPDGRLVAYDL